MERKGWIDKRQKKGLGKGHHWKERRSMTLIGMHVSRGEGGCTIDLPPKMLTKCVKKKIYKP
jgi:hypothetical protein